MNEAFATALAAHGASLVTHIAVYNDGVAVGAARIPVTWAGAGSIKNPSANLVFAGTPSTPIDEWRGFSALTGGTDYGGAALVGTGFDVSGNFTLLAASTNFDVSPV
jgi:hypothetical protein